MSKYATKREVYQSYFKNMCKTFYVAYREVKRLEKEKLKETKEKADKKKNEVDAILGFWIKEYANCISNITEIIEQMKEKNFLITVTCKEEVIVLMEYFAQNSVKEHRIINQEEESLKKFPTGDEICKEFYEAYTMEDDDKMTEVIKKYF